MINISINEGNVQTKISGSGAVILAEAVTSVGALYDNLKELGEKPVADFYAFLAKDLLEKRVKGIDVEDEPLEAAEKPKCEQHSEENAEKKGKSDTDDLLDKLRQIMGITMGLKENTKGIKDNKEGA